MKITGSGAKFKVDDKRFAIPGVKLTGECPACKKPYKHDFGGDLNDPMLAYPVVNASMDLNCWCPKCDHEWTIPIKVSVTVELVDPKASGT